MAASGHIPAAQSTTGDNAIQVRGNNNTINSTTTNIDMTHKPLTKSHMHRILKLLMDSSKTNEGDYSLNPPAPLERKLIYNQAPRYVNIIANHAEDYARLDDVLKDFPDSEVIIQRMNDFFIEVAEVQSDGSLCVGNGDAQLKSIETTIYALVVNDASFDANAVPEENIRQFCVALLAVAISKCRVLINPDGNHAATR